MSVVRRPPVQPPASPRVARRNSSTRGGGGSEHNTVTQPPSRSSIPVPTSNNTNEVSDSSSCNSDVSHPNPPAPVMNSSEVSSGSGTKNNGNMQESSKILLGNGTTSANSPTKSLTSITSLPKMKEIIPGGCGGPNKPEAEAAPIATLESTCEDLQEVKNGGDFPPVTANALAEMTANSDAMAAAAAVTPIPVVNSNSSRNPAGSPPTSTCMNEASPACV